MIRKYAVLLLLIISIGACELAEIDIDTILEKESEDLYELVVAGGVTSQYGPQVIKLTKPGDWSSPAQELGISNAKVFISDSKDTFLLEESPEEKGVYFSVEQFAGEINQTYSLYIELSDKKYTAKDKLVATPVIGNKVPGEKEELGFRNLISFTVKVHSFGFEEPSSRFYIGRNENEDSVYQYQNIDYFQFSEERPSISPNGIFYQHEGTPPQGVFPADYANRGFASSDSVQIVVLSMSEAYYDFLISALNETEWSNGFLSPIRGNIKTNLSSGATGFFRAVDVQIESFHVNDLEAL